MNGSAQPAPGLRVTAHYRLRRKNFSVTGPPGHDQHPRHHEYRTPPPARQLSALQASREPVPDTAAPRPGRGRTTGSAGGGERPGPRFRFMVTFARREDIISPAARRRLRQVRPERASNRGHKRAGKTSLTERRAPRWAGTR